MPGGSGMEPRALVGRQAAAIRPSRLLAGGALPADRGGAAEPIAIAEAIAPPGIAAELIALGAQGGAPPPPPASEPPPPPPRALGARARPPSLAPAARRGAARVTRRAQPARSARGHRSAVRASDVSRAAPDAAPPARLHRVGRQVGRAARPAHRAGRVAARPALGGGTCEARRSKRDARPALVEAGTRGMEGWVPRARTAARMALGGGGARADGDRVGADRGGDVAGAERWRDRSARRGWLKLRATRAVAEG
jgi:hypothetical protein